jgi:hypothetical protein
MSQWYPKLCEYDYEGWHPTPYVAREFYGVWGDLKKISIDKKYIWRNRLPQMPIKLVVMKQPVLK